MKHYRDSRAHLLAMRLLSGICPEASYVRWTQDSPDLPDWDEAHRRLLAEGRLSKIVHQVIRAGRTPSGHNLPHCWPSWKLPASRMASVTSSIETNRRRPLKCVTLPGLPIGIPRSFYVKRSEDILCRTLRCQVTGTLKVPVTFKSNCVILESQTEQLR
jgi:hypothetical protein